MHANRTIGTRRDFVRTAGAMLAAVCLDPRRPHAPMHIPLVHPDPRPGITSERVLGADVVGKSFTGKVAQAYDAARAYPEVFDGVACGCGCAPSDGTHRSLLSCYESRQPTGCQSCQTEAILVARLAKRGDPLGKIREAVDAS